MRTTRGQLNWVTSFAISAGEDSKVRSVLSNLRLEWWFQGVPVKFQVCGVSHQTQWRLQREVRTKTGWGSGRDAFALDGVEDFRSVTEFREFHAAGDQTRLMADGH